MNTLRTLSTLAFFSLVSSGCSAGAPAAEANSSAADLSTDGRALHCWSNADCADLQFCDTEASGTCGGRGVCTSRGINLMCVNIDVLACGCDGNPYPNSCIAHKAGVSINPQPFGDTSIDGDTLAEQPWTDASQTYFYVFTGNGTTQNDSGTFQAKVEPPCLRAAPACTVQIVSKKGTFMTFGSFVELNYDDGSTAFFEAQTDCHNTWRLLGDDFGQPLSLAVSTVTP